MAAKEQSNPPREDNKILQKEIDHAIRDENEGNDYAEDFADRVDDARKKLDDEIANTVTPIDQQKISSRKSAPVDIVDDADARKHIDDEVDKATYERVHKL